MPRGPRFLANEADVSLCFFTVTQLMMAWTALREGHISLKDLRVYFALAEILAQSRPHGGASGEAAHKFSAQELRQLVGGEWGKRSAVEKLLAVGLIRDSSKSTIEFATDPSELRFVPETLDAALARISNKQQRLVVPVPRHMLCLIASSGARRTLIATVLGHLIRCLKHGASHPKGCVKASWIANVFGISAGAVKRQRKHLVELGWLIPQGTSRQITEPPWALHGRQSCLGRLHRGRGGAGTRPGLNSRGQVPPLPRRRS